MNLRHLIFLLCSLISLNSLPLFADDTEEIYRYERMWPVLPQPWYFNGIQDIAVSQQGHVYVAEWNHNRVLKLTLEGHLISQIGAGRFEEPVRPVRIAVDSQENLYVLYRYRNPVEGNSFLRKFNANGEFIPPKWEGKKYAFSFRNDIAIDSQDNLYFPDRGAREIKKFTADGEFIEKLPIEPREDYVYLSIAIDGEDNIYILEGGFLSERQYEHSIMKYTPNGELVKRWGQYGSGPGEFKDPTSIAIDKHNHLYVADSNNHRIQKFDSKGQFIEQWHDEYDRSEWAKIIQSSPFLTLIQFARRQFGFDNTDKLITKFVGSVNDKDIINLDFLNSDYYNPHHVAVGPQDHLYVSYTSPNNGIKKYTLQNDLIAEWSSHVKHDTTNVALDIVTDKQGNIYTTDMFKHRVLKFTAAGELITEWGEPGKGKGKFILPTGIAIDSDEHLYILDLGNLRIQKFDANGQFITQWGRMNLNPNSQSGFLFPLRISVDAHNQIYVVDPMSHYPIKQFSSNGQFLRAFGKNELDVPAGISIDHNDNIYVVDAGKHTVNKFNKEGHQIKQWGELGKGDGQFEYPSDVATDNEGHVYVLDAYNHRIQKFTSEGQFKTKLGQFGTFPGQFGEMGGLTVSPDGERIYVTEVLNRFQVFNRSLYDVGKAIIVAGGGSYEGNDLWDDTQLMSNFAYRALAYQGFTKNTMYYLSEATQLDLDNNGELDDVDAEPSLENLKKAITEWAKDANHLTLFLTDHGGHQQFTLKADETLTATNLNDWLNTWQNQQPDRRIKLIYDACYSGSFIQSLEGKNRIIITSSAADELAYFDDKGSLSFSSYFWTHVFNGIDVGQAFREASDAVNYLHDLQTTQKQTPWLEANGDVCANQADDFEAVKHVFIGNGTEIHAEAPIIEALSPIQNLSDTQQRASIEAEIQDEDIARVWAVVRSPAEIQRHIYSSDNNPDELVGQPIIELPSFELRPVEKSQCKWELLEKSKCYQGHYDQFEITGQYHLAVYARDRYNHTAIPKTTSVFVKNPLKRKAILISGDLEEGIQNIKDAHEALNYQGYQDEQMHLISKSSVPGVNIQTVQATLDNVEFALTNWAKDKTQNLVIYLEGLGDETGFRLSQDERLPFAQFKTWLDALQLEIPGAVTVIYEGPQSGHLLPALKQAPEDKTRIVISSASVADSHSDGDILNFSFSQLFWQKVYNGANTRNAFRYTKDAIERAHQQRQMPQLDADSNGIGNESQDYKIAKRHSLGIGVVSANSVSNSPEEKTGICLRPSKTDYRFGEAVQVSLSHLPRSGEKAYFVIGLPDEKGLYSIQQFNQFAPVDQIETIPVWSGDGDQVMEMMLEGDLPAGAYRLYSITLPEEAPLELTPLPKTLCQSRFCVSAK